VRRVLVVAIAAASGAAACELVVDTAPWQVDDGGLGTDASDAAAVSESGDGGSSGDAISPCQAAMSCFAEAGACMAACASAEQQCTAGCGNNNGCAGQCKKVEGDCRNACATTCVECANSVDCKDMHACPQPSGP
jgi:hypothetical protein